MMMVMSSFYYMMSYLYPSAICVKRDAFLSGIYELLREYDVEMVNGKSPDKERINYWNWFFQPPQLRNRRKNTGAVCLVL